MGKIGVSLGTSLTQAGHTIQALHDINPDRIQRFIRGSDDTSGFNDWGRCQIVIIAVPDAHLEAVVDEWEKRRQFSPGTLICHTCGARDGSVLAPLETFGDTGVFHPLLSVPEGSIESASFQGVLFGIDGNPHVLEILKDLAASLGATTAHIPSEFRGLYHAAGVLAGNFPTVLASLAEHLIIRAGVSPEIAWSGVIRLMQSVTDNLSNLPPEDALTGPVIRGDTGTIQRHLDDLNRWVPEMIEIYTGLTRAAAKMACRGGSITPAAEIEIQNLLTDESDPRD